jgi:hypothetical protein
MINMAELRNRCVLCQRWVDQEEVPEVWGGGSSRWSVCRLTPCVPVSGLPPPVSSYFVSKEFGLCGLEVACWPLEPKVHGFKPVQSLRIFSGRKKILSTPSFQKGSKSYGSHVVHLRHVKYHLNATWKSVIFKAKLCLSFLSSHSSHLSAARISRKTTSGESWKTS